MPTEQQSQGGRRPHFHRGRRGHDRRGDRRPQSQTATEPTKSDGVDVDQLVREIKTRIAQRHGIDLTEGQIQELAARRLEAILDPRTLKPSLLEQLRRSAGAPADIAPAEPTPAFAFEDHTIFDTHNGLLRTIRGLLAPVLKLFFNPNPISHALNAQAKLNKESAVREAERDRTQAEWNALHYALLQRVVTEISRVTIETQSLALKVEALGARVDFYERRVRGLENSSQPAASAQVLPSVASPSVGPRPPMGTSEAPAAADGPDGARRRRRRRRGRRGPGGLDGGPGMAPGGNPSDVGGDDGPDDGPDEDASPVSASSHESPSAGNGADAGPAERSTPSGGGPDGEAGSNEGS